MLKNFLITAWRNIAKHKLYTFLNVSGLAIGIVVCLFIGVWLERELNYDRFHPHQEQLFRLSNTFKSESESFSQAPSGPALGGRLPQLLPAIQSACRTANNTYKVTVGNQQFIESRGLQADSNFFQFFGFTLVSGKAADCLHQANGLVLTQRLVKKYFGDTDPLGKTVILDDQNPMIVSAVAADPPVNSHIQFDMVISMAQVKDFVKRRMNADIDDMWVGGWMNTYFRLKDPARATETEEQINQIAAKYSAKEWKENKMSYHYFFQPVRDIHLKSHLRYDAGNNGNITQVNIFSIVGIIVMLLACINYINLTTASAIQRAKETSVRKVIGASKWLLVRQFFFETLIICSMSVLLGLICFKGILPFFSEWIGQPYDFPLNATNILDISAFVLVISIISGIYPALILSSFNPISALKGQFVQGNKGSLIRKSLVAFQFTISIALIASILIINQQMDYIRNKSLGFDGNAVLEIDFNGDQQITDKFASIKSELLKNQYVRSVSTQDQHMVGGMGNGWTTTENLAGEEISTSLYSMHVDEDYFSTYSMQLAAGRFLSLTYPSDSTKSVLVNEAAVRTFGWKTPEQALGKKFGKGDRTKYVVGVVRDFNFESLRKPVEALMIGYTRSGGMMSLKIDGAHADQAIEHLKKTWTSIAPSVPLEYTFMDDVINRQYGQEQKMEAIFYVFSALSMLIGCFGLFGLTTFVVERKIKEIGIRKILGASVPGIVHLLSRDFIKLVLLSMLVATPIAWYFMNNWLGDFAYRIHIDMWIFVKAGLVALVITLCTVSLKAIKAALANPVSNLRSE